LVVLAGRLMGFVVLQTLFYLSYGEFHIDNDVCVCVEDFGLENMMFYTMCKNHKNLEHYLTMIMGASNVQRTGIGAPSPRIEIHRKALPK
jgi:hypothetical protein